MKRTLLLLLGVVGCWRAASVGPERVEDPPLGQLLNTVTPKRYAITLDVDPTADSYKGVVSIDVDIAQPTRTVWLHGKELRVEAVELVRETGERIAGRYEQPAEVGVARVAFHQQVPQGRARLVFRFTAPFGKRLSGLYRVQAGGAWYAFTQMEPTSAREAFPCFDEPRFKTPFEVTLNVRSEHAAIANTQAVSSERYEDGTTRVQFAPTEPLPTYLVALAVGPLDVVQGPDLAPNTVRQRPVPLRAVTVRGRGDEASYALAETPAMLETLERYLGLPYPYDKLDIIAVPDFSAGGMENAGAITFSDGALLLDPQTASLRQKQRFAHVMAHELAHQWFGDLVTMPWWDDLWLNESFATWMQARVVEERYPTYRADLDAVEDARRAMGVDALATARAIQQPITSHHDIMNAFDGITYLKGGAVIAMFERYVGADAFQRGLTHYLRKHSHATATTNDLIAALAEVAGPEVGSAWSSFLSQPGVPLVDVDATCVDGVGQLTLAQSRYVPVGSTATTATTWRIPMCVRYGVGSKSHEECSLLGEATSTVVLRQRGCPTWIVPNANAAGYYRVNLPAPALASALKAPLSQRERLALANDVVAGFYAGKRSLDGDLPLVASFARSDERAVAAVPMQLLTKVHDNIVRPELRPNVAATLRALYAPVLARLGFSTAPRAAANELPEEVAFRTRVVELLADQGADAVLRAQLKSAAQAYLDMGTDNALHPESLDSNYLGVALWVLVQEGDAQTFDAVLARLEQAQDGFLRGQLILALGATTDPRLAARARHLALDPRLRQGEVLLTLAAQARVEPLRPALLDFVDEHFAALRERAAEGSAGYLPMLFTSFCSEAEAAHLDALLRERLATTTGGPRNLNRALEAIRLCAALREAQADAVNALFQTPPALAQKR